MKNEKQSGKRYSLAQRHPALWVSRAHRGILPWLIVGVAEAAIGYALPPTASPTIAAVIGIVCFLVVFAQGRTYQYYFYDENLSRHELGKLYLINLAIALVQGSLLLIAPYAQHLRARHDIPEKEKFIEDVLTVRLANATPGYVQLAKLYLLEPTSRSFIESASTEVFDFDPFVYESLGSVTDTGSKWRNGVGIAAMPVRQRNTNRSDSSIEIQILSQSAFDSLYNQVFSLNYQPKSAMVIYDFDTSSSNPVAYRMIAGLNEERYDSLLRRNASLSDKYPIGEKNPVEFDSVVYAGRRKDIANFNRFEAIVLNILEVRSFDTPYSPPLPWTIYLVILQCVPVLILHSLVCRKYVRRIRGIMFPLWPVGWLLSWFVGLLLVVGLLLFVLPPIVLEGNGWLSDKSNRLYLLIGFATLVLTLAASVILTRNRSRWRDARMLLLQALHIHLTNMLFLLAFQFDSWTALTYRLQESAFIALLILVHIATLPLVRLYHVAQYRPSNN